MPPQHSSTVLLPAPEWGAERQNRLTFRCLGGVRIRTEDRGAARASVRGEKIGVLLIIRGVFEWRSSQEGAVGRRSYQLLRMAVVLRANEYITEGVHRSSWIRSQKTESFEGIPIRSELSNKDLILYPFLDLLYTERLPGSCNTRVSSEISWTQHVASFPHRLVSISGDDICFVCPCIQYNPTFFGSQSSGTFGEFETRVQWRKPGASVTTLLLRMPGRLCLFSSLLEASQFDRPCFFPGYREGFVVSSWP